MKHIILILIVSIGLSNVLNAQCGVNSEEILKNCEGIFLLKREFNDKQEAKQTIVLNDSIRYSMYFLNPNKGFPKYSFKYINDENKQNVAPFSDFETKVGKNNEYIVFTFTSNVAGLYELNVDFEDKKDACVLWAFYFRKAIKKSNTKTNKQ